MPILFSLSLKLAVFCKFSMPYRLTQCCAEPDLPWWGPLCSDVVGALIKSNKVTVERVKTLKN